MAQVNAGRVRFVGRGEYNNSTQYYVFDLVSYNGNSYYAKVDTIGHLPTDTTYWQLVAEKGNIGPTGLTGNGISSIEKTSTSGLVDTYTITYTNGNTTTFDVSNGNGIDRIEKTATVGNKDTYTIYFTNGSTTTYEVSNGEVTREELEEEVERLSMIYNAFPSTTGEVEEGSINGTAEVPFKEIGLKGNTSQESTTGANLQKFSPRTAQSNVYSCDDKGQVTIQGQVSQYIGLSYNIQADYMSLSAGTYKLKVIGNSTGVTFSTENAKATLSSFDSNQEATLTVTEDITNFQIFQYLNTGITYNCSYYITLASGNTATTERYTNGPAPNPDYPYPVNVVTGDNEVKVEGKNLLDNNNIQNAYQTTATILPTGFNATGNYYVSYPFNLNDGTYTINYDFELKSGTAASTTGKARLQYDDDTYSSYQEVPYTFNTDKKIKNILFYIGLGNTVSGDFTNVQLEESSTSSTYEPYQSQTYPINLGSMELCKIGDYQDYIYKENGVWYKYGAIGKVVLDGTQEIRLYNWRASETSVGWVYAYNVFNNQYNPANIIGNVLSDKLMAKKFDDLFGKNVDYGISTYTNTDYGLALRVGDTLLTTTSAINTYLSSNPIATYFALATPTITEITDTTLIEQLDNLEKAYSYDTQTNISQTNQDKPFIISYEAILSLRNVLNS